MAGLTFPSLIRFFFESPTYRRCMQCCFSNILGLALTPRALVFVWSLAVIGASSDLTYVGEIWIDIS